MPDENLNVEQDKAIECCDCCECNHELRRVCIDQECNCCNLEDAYSIITGIDAGKYLKY